MMRLLILFIMIALAPSLRAQNTNVEALFSLAEAYGNEGKMREAIAVYQQIHDLDETYSEAWAGMGKMYYWLEQPVTAARCYRRALELDPGNEEILEGYQNVRQESAWGLTLRTSPFQEKEEDYTINAITTRLKIEKRITDRFRLEANFLLDYSNRDFTDEQEDTTRWYNSSWLKAEYIGRHHTIGAYGGYSNTDNKASSYGAYWRLVYKPGKFILKNALQAGYDYYYYWNKVGATSATDEVSAAYDFIELGGSYSFGVVDAVYTYDPSTTDTGEIRTNPYQAYGITLSFRILKRPDLRAGLVHSYLDYTYKSPLYYSPDKRRLTGAFASLFWKVSRFYVYGNLSYKIGSEINYGDKMNVNNWTTRLEIGYDHDPISVSLGESSFYNPYYQNITVFAAIKVLL